MKIEELRIGNWVQVGQILTFVDKIDDANNSGVGVVGNLLHNDIEDVAPIPLTDEWLENFGFIKTDDSGYCELEFEGTNTRLFITLDDELARRSFGKCYYGFDHHVNAEIQLNIQYVHQLQNLVFALTGKDLILKSESWD